MHYFIILLFSVSFFTWGHGFQEQQENQDFTVKNFFRPLLLPVFLMFPSPTKLHRQSQSQSRKKDILYNRGISFKFFAHFLQSIKCVILLSFPLKFFNEEWIVPYTETARWSVVSGPENSEQNGSTPSLKVSS